MKNAVGRVQGILLLGATSDIGQAIVRRVANESAGARVVLAARRPESCNDFAAELRGCGSEVEVLGFDADDLSGHARLFDDAVRGGDLDVVITAWGVLGSDQSLLDEDPAAAAAVATTNYVGVVSVGLHAARALRRQGHGTIVHLSSVAAERVRRANYVYGSSKAGSDAFMQGLGDALADTAVRVLVVRPGFVHSKMTAGMKAAPLSTTPDAVAEATLAALKRPGGVVWVPAALRPVFMIFRHLPRAVWRRMPA